MKHLLTICLTAGLSLLFVGCATTPEGGISTVAPVTGDLTKELVFELATKVAVSEQLNGDLEAAALVESGATLLIETLETGQIATPEIVDEALYAWLAEADLQPSSKQSIKQVIDTLKNHYLARVNAGQLDPSITAPVITIATWVKEAAQDTARFNGVRDYGLPPIETVKAKAL